MKKFWFLAFITTVLFVMFLGNTSEQVKATTWHPPMTTMYEVIYRSAFDCVNPPGCNEDGKVDYRVYDASTGTSYWKHTSVSGTHPFITWPYDTFYAPNGWTAIMVGYGYTTGDHTSHIIVGGIQAEADGQYPNWSLMYTIDF